MNSHLSLIKVRDYLILMLILCDCIWLYQFLCLPFCKMSWAWKEAFWTDVAQWNSYALVLEQVNYLTKHVLIPHITFLPSLFFRLDIIVPTGFLNIRYLLMIQCPFTMVMLIASVVHIPFLIIISLFAYFWCYMERIDIEVLCVLIFIINFDCLIHNDIEWYWIIFKTYRIFFSLNRLSSSRLYI